MILRNNFHFQEWDAGLSSDACNEARGIVPSNAPHKFKAEKTFVRDGLVPDMIMETLKDGLKDKIQTENVRNFLHTPNMDATASSKGT
ncbi:hypothetical protein COOONC_06393 [Cooperia oncophora]